MSQREVMVGSVGFGDCQRPNACDDAAAAQNWSLSHYSPGKDAVLASVAYDGRALRMGGHSRWRVADESVRNLSVRDQFSEAPNCSL